MGGGGVDTISTGAGVDRIWAGAGADAITGGTGLDQFVMAVGDATPTITGTGASGVMAGHDTIADYALGTAATNAETIDLLGVTDAVLGDGAVNGTDSF